ncbi:MAG: Crp/Fnr family transcriptional regulator [Bacteroidetes bacterium]|nr:Crp/Fnr family transcriptional regulator [Bacteroidota bacterium]MBX7238824.1 Crp/Fnr family transcriptional regulator [Bacteroidia bacterium]MCW5919116.1 Crp/Fnr family transcriptional regulator [Bacteroidota bacterium]HCI58434.1 Crp/Fnr family transcriptional regulator [Bacteroidota bacterium]HMU77027.1 Crp/Fnr family transcriptional regulator [Bacteroidia bacterium]
MDNIAETLEFKSSPALREKLISYGTTKKFNAGDVILNENAYIRSIPIVLSGSIRVMRNDDEGREILLYYIKSGESCIMSFLGGIHQDTSKVRAVAEDETEILFVPVDKVITLIREHDDWLDFIFRLYHKRFEELLEVVNAVAFKKIDERLILLLQKKAELSKSKTITVTHEQLANELGTARVVVSRLLKQLEVDGRVELGRNKITLLQ